MYPTENKFPSINGLRAISIILVIIHHVNIREHMFDGNTTHIWIKPFTDFLRDGQMGVNIFFILSGFLITTLMLREEGQSTRISLKNFYIRRTLRIFPAYYFMLSVYFILQIFNIIHLSPVSWLTSLTYTKYFNNGLDWSTAHAWSLSVEETFYILWPLIFLLGSRFRKSISWTLICLVPFIRIYTFYHPIYWINEMSIFMRIDAIATGCLFSFYKDEILKSILQYKKLFFYSSICLLFFLRYSTYILGYFDLGNLLVPTGLTHGTIANVLIGFIMLYSIFVQQGRWFDFLNLKIMNYIGILSYSIYLWQQIFFSGMDHWIFKFPENLLFIFLSALFSYYLIERPFLRLKDRYTKNEKWNRSILTGLAKYY